MRHAPSCAVVALSAFCLDDSTDAFEYAEQCEDIINAKFDYYGCHMPTSDDETAAMRKLKVCAACGVATAAYNTHTQHRKDAHKLMLFIYTTAYI